MLPDNSTYGTINILGLITGGGSGMDLADNDPTLFRTWLGAGNESNIIEIRQVPDVWGFLLLNDIWGWMQLTDIWGWMLLNDIWGWMQLPDIWG